MRERGYGGEPGLVSSYSSPAPGAIMRRTTVHIRQLTDFASSPQPDRAKGSVEVSRRAAYAAFAWVLAFLAWHVVWAVTGLEFPHHHWSGAGRMLMWGFDAVIYLMAAVGLALPLAL